jgi:hypothetical protein
MSARRRRGVTPIPAGRPAWSEKVDADRRLAASLRSASISFDFAAKFDVPLQAAPPTRLTFEARTP